MSFRYAARPGVSFAKIAEMWTGLAPDGTNPCREPDAQRNIAAQSLHLSGRGACFPASSGQHGMSSIIDDMAGSELVSAAAGAAKGATTSPAATSQTHSKRSSGCPFMPAWFHKPAGLRRPAKVTKSKGRAGSPN
jgi:hypothetical protein